MGERIIILGAGGHGKEVCVLLQINGFKVIGFLDDDPSLRGTRVLGILVLGPITKEPLLKADGAIVGIGNNKVRRSFFAKLRSWGVPIVSAIHPSVFISQEVRLGQGLMAQPGVVINVSSTVGDDVIFTTGVIIGHDVSIGDHAFFGPNASVCGDVEIGPLAFIGAGATVIPGIKIGEGAVIGAGAVVVEDIPPYSLAVGVPARVIKKLGP
ncbi:MAG: acetyltransferase [Anaerolineae bacterium]|nr:acetyltransferase [Anaerolineae bacterium]